MLNMLKVDDHFLLACLFWAFTAFMSCDSFVLIQSYCLPFLHTSTIWLQILVFSVNIILLQIASIVFKRHLLFITGIGLFVIICNKNKLCARIILGVKEVLDVWQFIHFKFEDYKHVSMTGVGGGERWEGAVWVYCSTL